MREFHIVVPPHFSQISDPELAILCHFIYIYENGRVVMQVPISFNRTIIVYIYDLYEQIRREDSRLFRSNIIRAVSADSSISYCYVSIVYTKKNIRIGRHYSTTHQITHKQRIICEQNKSLETYNIMNYKWSMDRLFFLRLNVTAGQAMEMHVLTFLQSIRSNNNIRTPCDLLSQLIRYGNEQVYFYKADIDITNGEENDYCDSAIEDTGCGDCEDSSHFIVRFVNTLSMVGEALAKLILNDPNTICSIIKQIAQFEPRLLLCFNKENDFHCLNVFVSGTQHYYVDSTSVDTAFIGDEVYEKKYGKKCFLISRLHIGIYDDPDGNFFNPEREF
jgi:hypothetical protein